MARPRRLSHRLTMVLGLASGWLASGFFAAPVWAAGPIVNESGTPGGRLTWVQTALIFAGIPIAVFLLIGFLVYLPSLVRGPRYRPGRPWPGGAAWFGGPPDPEAAVSRIEEIPPSTAEGGGAGARW
ncbi:MAG: hypothetical protein K6T37_05835 [Acidothermus cellulolyticus]|nr:hypothetical protein [Acidothermus cellulolyticus]